MNDDQTAPPGEGRKMNDDQMKRVGVSKGTGEA